MLLFVMSTMLMVFDVVYVICGLYVVDRVGGVDVCGVVAFVTTCYIVGVAGIARISGIVAVCVCLCLRVVVMCSVDG